VLPGAASKYSILSLATTTAATSNHQPRTPTFLELLVISLKKHEKFWETFDEESSIENLTGRWEYYDTSSVGQKCLQRLHNGHTSPYEQNKLTKKRSLKGKKGKAYAHHVYKKKSPHKQATCKVFVAAS